MSVSFKLVIFSIVVGLIVNYVIMISLATFGSYSFLGNWATITSMSN